MRLFKNSMRSVPSDKSKTKNGSVVLSARRLQFETLERRELLSASRIVGPLFSELSVHEREVVLRKSHADLSPCRIYGPLWSEFVASNSRKTVSVEDVENYVYSLKERPLTLPSRGTSDLPAFEEYVSLLKSAQDKEVVAPSLGDSEVVEGSSFQRWSF